MKKNIFFTLIFSAFSVIILSVSVLFAEESETSAAKNPKSVSCGHEFTLLENESAVLEKMRITLESNPFYILAEEYGDKIRIAPLPENRYTRFHDYVIVYLGSTEMEFEADEPIDIDEPEEKRYFLFRPEKERNIITKTLIKLKILYSKLEAEAEIKEWEAVEIAIKKVAKDYLPQSPEIAEMVEARALPVSTGKRRFNVADKGNESEDDTWEIAVPFYDNLYTVHINAVTGKIITTDVKPR